MRVASLVAKAVAVPARAVLSLATGKRCVPCLRRRSPAAFLVALLVLGMALPLVAQTGQYGENFQQVPLHAIPADWNVSLVGAPSAVLRERAVRQPPLAADALSYEAVPDPAQPANVVFGPINPPKGPVTSEPRSGTFATFTGRTFSGRHLEYRGRAFVSSPDARLGFTFLSGYPAGDRYDVIALWPASDGTISMQLFAFPPRSLSGSRDSRFRPQVGRWFHFVIRTDDDGSASTIRARFWSDGSAEPTADAILAVDASPSRLREGRIGLWAAMAPGAWFDDLSVVSRGDASVAISFLDAERHQVLDPSFLALFNHDARIAVETAPAVPVTLLVDGVPGSAASAVVSAEGTHVLVARATSHDGIAAEETLRLIVDKSPPLLTMRANGSPFSDGAMFGAPVTVTVDAADATATTVTASIDGRPSTLPLYAGSEATHTIAVTAVDALGWSSSLTAALTIDMTPPSIRVQANGSELASGSMFGSEVTLSWQAEDPHLASVSAALDGVPASSGVVVTSDAEHSIVVTATDRAGNRRSVTRSFLIAKQRPSARLLVNGGAFADASLFSVPVRFAVDASVAPQSVESSIDGGDWDLTRALESEGAHTIQVTLRFAAAPTITLGPFHFSIDRTPPAIEITESGQPFVDGMRFSRDVLPVVRVRDNLASTPRTTLLIDGQPYPLGKAIVEESASHILRVEAVDDAGNAASVGPLRFLLDKSRPIVSITDGSGRPVGADALFRAPIAFRIVVSDLTRTSVRATLSTSRGSAALEVGAGVLQPDGRVVYITAPVSVDERYSLTVVATDEVGLSSDPVEATFRLDQTPIALHFTEPEDNALLATPSITVRGVAGNAQTVTVNGRAALVDPLTGSFTLSGVALVEGRNELVAVGGAEGIEARTTRIVNLDTRAPELVVQNPVAGTCTNAAQIEIRGSVMEPHLASLTISTPGATVMASPDDAGRWMASLPLGSEGPLAITVDARDALAHRAVSQISVTVDRTAPALEVTLDGRPFTGGAFNHPLAVFVRVLDRDPAVQTLVRLNDKEYAPGTTVAAAGRYTLTASARDCAGNLAPETSIAFAIDTTPPSVVSLDPADGSIVGATPPALRGVVDADDLRSVVVEGSAIQGSVNGRTFTVAGVPVVEGSNRFVLILTDTAGNSARHAFSFRLKSTIPMVEILENDLPIVSGTMFNRAVYPVIRSNEAGVNVTATIDGAAFVSGTEVGGQGIHTLVATAADSLGHSSAPASVAFTIDTIAPVVTITSPSAKAVIESGGIEVRGVASGGDLAGVTVNGIAVATAPDGSFIVNVPLDYGANVLTAIAVDLAGNAGTASVEVTRDDGRPGLILTSPADRSVTNRPAIAVAGQLLTVRAGSRVTINGVEVMVGASGAFRRESLALDEGDNAIAVAVAGSTRGVTVHVLADFTPPVLTVLANGTDLVDGARYADAPSISLRVSDVQAVATSLVIDGSAVSAPFSALRAGSHSLVATARDAAGNQTRVLRSFLVGSGSGAGSPCRLTAFDPPDRSALSTDSVRLSGRVDGASAVLVNGAAAQVASGSFAASVSLTQNGANPITIACAGSNGVATTDPPVTLTLFRESGSPSIAILAPAAESVLTTTMVTVSGTVGPEGATGDVNGIPFTPGRGSFSVANVILSPGLNVITARVRSRSGRLGVASVNVVLANGAPQIAITSPLPGTETGADDIYVSGIYSNADPSTIAVGTGATPWPLTAHATSDTSGTFVATAVRLTTAASTTITTTARNRAGAQAQASVTVTNAAGAPSLTITSPADNTAYRADQALEPITGAISAVPASLVRVNGVEAAVDPSFHFMASVPFTGSAASMPVIARVTTPAGRSASASIRVQRMSGPLRVVRTFPESGASAESGVALVMLFSNPLDGSTARGAITLADDGGQPITGSVYVDRDAISFAPQIPLTAGRRYVLTLAQTLRDIAGGTLPAPFTLSFTTTASAPAASPVVDQSDRTGCLTSEQITGRASAAGARVRLDLDGVAATTTAGGDGRFSFSFRLSGQLGFHIARIREVGSDGTLSPERDVTYRVDCGGPQVLGASLDRKGRRLSIQFSRPMNASSLVASAGGTILLAAAGGQPLSGQLSLSSAGDEASVVFDAQLPAAALQLTISTAVRDANSVPLSVAFTKTFALDDAAAVIRGNGTVAGVVLDAMTGRPLAGATIVFSRSSVSATTDDHGRYARSLPEGPYTVEVTKPGFTMAWRQLIVPAGGQLVPIDVRLARRGPEKLTGSAALELSHQSDPLFTRKVETKIPPSALAPGHLVSLTSIDGQSMAGLLPLGWSPLAAAEIAIDGAPASIAIPASTLSFELTAADLAAITAANVSLALVQYDPVRDEWRVVDATVVIDSASRKTLSSIAGSGNFALVYPDAAAGLARPAPARAGALLTGVSNACSAQPGVCAMTARSFAFEPESIPPDGRAIATLITAAAGPFPSGTVVQASIDEQLNLTDGRILNDSPLLTDLIVYRTLAGTDGIAQFALSPSAQATSVTLRDGADRVAIIDSPGRIERGALIGPAGGRVAGDDSMSLDVEEGSTSEPLHASLLPMRADEIAAVTPIAGFHVAAGFTLTLTRADSAPMVDLDGDGVPDPVAVVLRKPVRGTLTIEASKFTTSNRQVVVAEVLGSTAFGSMVRLASTTTLGAPASGGVQVAGIDPVNAAVLPIDGIIRPGRYLLLTADAPIAFAWGQVRRGAGGPIATGARVRSAVGSQEASPLGMADLTRASGVFAVPVAAKPASPFSLRPDSRAQGAGAVSVSAASPDAGSAVRVDLVLDPQPPRLVAISPRDVERDAAAPLQVQITFDTPIDPSSVAAGVTLTNATSGVRMNGTTGAAGPLVTFTPSEPLQPAATWVIVVLPSIRSISGAPFGQTASAQFTTAPIPLSGSIHPERIQITLPANGISIIRGLAGALPASANAVAVRRGHFFATQYQATAAADGSFQFAAGNADGLDRIRTDDAIDLRVIDAVSHSTIAIVPLTPFVTAEGDGVLARPDVATRFVNREGIGMTVPAGAFDVPTVVRASLITKAVFASVLSFDEELRPLASVRVEFEGVAHRRIELDLPVTTPLDAARSYYLGGLFDSVRGPRIMLVDTLRIAGSSLTTTLPASAAQSVLRPSSQGTHHAASSIAGISNAGEVKGAMLGVIQRGNYSAVDVVPALSWVFTSGLGEVDLFVSTFKSLFTSGFYLSQKAGKAFVPVVANVPFVMTGVDSGTGLSVFTKSYDKGLPPGDPLAATPLPPPTASSHGPYPTFASPGRIETLDVNAPQFTDNGHRGLTVSYDATKNPQMTISASVANPLAEGTHVEALNVTTGALQVADSLSTPLRLAASVGDRLVLLIGEQDVDPEGDLSVVFSEPLALVVPLAEQFEIAAADSAGSSAFAQMTSQATFSSDSGGRRIHIRFPVGLQRGRKFRLTMKRTIQSEIEGAGGRPLHIGEAIDEKGSVFGGASDLHLTFTTRAPGGSLGAFTLANPCAAQGSAAAARDFALSGNILFAAASGGGLLAYDVSNPAALASGAAPFAWAPDSGVSDTWSVATDAHGRVWTTALTEAFGVIRAYTVDSFIDAKQSGALDCSDPSKRPVPPLRGGMIVSYRPGFVESLPLSTSGAELNSTLTTKPEAIPRKLQLLVQDDETPPMTTEELLSKFGGVASAVPGNDAFQRISISASFNVLGGYYVQRVTFRNKTLGLSWSKDVLRGSSTTFSLLGRPGDSWVRSTNLTTYGVVSLFGFGVGVYDLNALESNRYATPPDPKHANPLEQVLVSDGAYRAQCAPTDPQAPPDPLNSGKPFECLPAALASIGQHCPIPDLSLTPEAIALPAASPQFTIYGLSPSLGIVDLSVVPPGDRGSQQLPSQPACVPRSPGLTLASKVAWPAQDSARVAFDHPRLNTLRKLYGAAASRAGAPTQPFARFNSIALYIRRTAPRPDAKPGTPDTISNYGLIAARDYGLLVVRLDPARPLDNDSLVDVVWTPAGAYSVRTVSGAPVATVIDGAGRVLLVDLTRVDESSQAPAGPMVCANPDNCAAPLFPTAAAAIAVRPAQSAGDLSRAWIEIGADDPRILWKSAPNSGSTASTLPPVVDPETGLLYRGDYNDPKAKIIAASDPRIRFVSDLGNPARTTEISGVTPLGIRPANCPPGTQCDTSGAAFRIEVVLPGSMTEAIPGANNLLRLAVESELVPGAAAPQTPAPLPRGHLRTTTRNGVTDPRPSTFALHRLLPDGPDSDLKRLRYQNAWNRWVSPTIVAIADPRAAREYPWNVSSAAKEAAGCLACDRPSALLNATPGTDYVELWTAGRSIAVRPELSTFNAAFYGFLGKLARMSGRIGTLHADLVRPSDGATHLSKVAATNLPTAGVMNEQVVTINTGEVMTTATDLAFRGRGISFALTRNYTSAITSIGPFGRNFDSPLFARVRRLPGGDVELYDGSGRRDLFAGGVKAPPGVFLEMRQTSTGETVVRFPDNTRFYFDGGGRLSRITDRNTTRADADDGNSMGFIYNAAGHLERVVDPTGRVVRFDYYTVTGGDGFEGCISTVTDFDGRKVVYQYDGSARLINVRGPDPESFGSATPSTTYRWPAVTSAGGRDSLYASASMTAEIDGMGRTVWQATYDPANPWAAKTLTSGGGAWTFNMTDTITTVTDPLAHSWEYGRDPEGRVTSVKQPGNAITSYAFDTRKRLASVTRPMGDGTAYGYGAGENVESIVESPRSGSQEATAGMTRQTRIAYGAASLPTSITTPDGTVTRIERDTRGNPKSITDSANVTIRTTYDEHGLLRSSSDPRSGTVEYGYERTGPNSGFLHDVTTPSGRTVLTNDARGNVLQVTDPSGRAASYQFNRLDQIETESRGGSLSKTTYDAAGNVSTRQTLAGVDSSNNPIFSMSTISIDEVGRLKTQNDNGRLSRTFYDAAGNVTRVESTGTSPGSYTYDNRNRIETLTFGGRTSTHFYDNDGNATGVRDARGHNTTFNIGGFGQSTGQTNAIGVTTVISSDAANRPIDERVVKTDGAGNRSLLRWTQRQYDPAGRMLKEIRKLFRDPLPLPASGADPTGATDVVTRWTYDDAARKVTVIDPNGSAVTTEADEQGRPLRVTDAVGTITTRSYNPNGTVESETVSNARPDGSRDSFKTTYAYDGENRLIRQSDVSDPAHPLTASFTYDVRGNRVSSTDPDGNVTRSEFDLRGRLVKTTEPEGGETKYEYDEADRMVVRTDANGNVTKFTFDGNGNPSTETRVDGATWKYTYDENHNLQTVTDANGSVTTFVYDSLDRLVEKRIVRASAVLGPSRVTLALDDLGRLTGSATDEGVREEFAYDSLDRQLAESLEFPAFPKKTIVKSYDAASNLIGVTYASGLDLVMNVDPLGRIRTIGERGGARPLVSYADSGSRMIARSLASGLSTQMIYDPNARLKAILAAVPGAAPAAQIAYALTPAGLKTSVGRSELAKNWTYRFDRNGRIINEAILRTDTEINPMRMSTDYTIDPTLNYRSITRNTQDTAGVTAQTTNTTVNNRNQYTSFASLAPTYDPNGNLTRLGGSTLQYDIDNHLTKAVTSTGTIVETLYAASGRKVREKITTPSTSATTDSLSLGPQVIEEFRDGKLSARYVHGRQIDEIVRAEIDGTTLFPIQDELNNVLALTDTSGKLLERYEYEGHGRVLILSPTNTARATSAYSFTRFFQGRNFNSVLDTYDFRARTLWPDLGRFGQEDPAGAIDHPNLNQALLGDWAGNSDPSGEVVVLMHGIVSEGEWAAGVGEELARAWDANGADAGQDVANLVDQRLGGFNWLGLCDPGQFCFQNAIRASRNTFDEATLAAGKRVGSLLQQMSAAQDASASRRGEPLQVIAHSHGTAMLLAAVRQRNTTRNFRLTNALLVGSDLDPLENLDALYNAVAAVYNFFSPQDRVTTAVFAAGSAGFQQDSYFDPERQRFESSPRAHVQLTQALVPGVAHAGNVNATTFGDVPWMSRKLAREYYASITQVTADRLAGESESWLTSYRLLRRQMGLGWTIGLRREFYEPYPNRNRP